MDQQRYPDGAICKVLQIAPSEYRCHAAAQLDPARWSNRANRDDVLVPQVERVWQSNMQAYGVYKVWRSSAVRASPSHAARSID